MSPNADFSPESAIEGGKIAFKPILTVFDVPSKSIDSPSKHVAKRAKHDEGGSTPSEGSSRVRFHLHRLHQFLTCSRTPLTISRGSR